MLAFSLLLLVPLGQGCEYPRNILGIEYSHRMTYSTQRVHIHNISSPTNNSEPPGELNTRGD